MKNFPATRFCLIAFMAGLSLLLALVPPIRAGENDIVVFGDPELAEVVLFEIHDQGIPDPPDTIDQITEGHMAQLVKIAPYDLGTWFFGTQSLEGLQFAVNLERLELQGFWSGPPYDLTPIAGLTCLRELSLYEFEFTDIRQLRQLTGLEFLRMDRCLMEAAPDISLMPDLEELILVQNQITDLSGLENHVGLSRLVLRSNGVSDLSPLAGLTGLIEIDLGHNAISDLSPLAGLTGVEILDLWRNDVSDLTPLAGLTNMRILEFRDCEVLDITPLAGLTSLQLIDLDENRVADISPIAGSSSLNWVRAKQNRLETLPDMSAMTSLGLIELSRNFLDPFPNGPAQLEIAALRARGVNVIEVQQRDPFRLLDNEALEAAIRIEINKPIGWIRPEDMLNLTSLSAPASNVDDLEGLEFAINLEVLLLPENEIRNLSELEGLTSLRELDLGLNYIIDLSPLAGLSSLRDLDLSWNAIIDIGPLAALTDLEELDLDGNGIDLTPGSIPAGIIADLEAAGVPVDVNGQTWPVTDFGSLRLRDAVVRAIGFTERLITPDDLIPLRRLIVPWRSIDDLSGLEDAANLELLQISDNMIADLTPLAGLQNLKMLDISDNQNVTDLSALSGLTNLRYLDMSILQVPDLSALTGLVQLEHLVIDEVTDPNDEQILADLAGGGTMVHEGVPLAAPSPGELAFSKIHYKPQTPSPAEVAAGFDLRSFFEYVEIVNLSDKTIDLEDVESEGGDFEFCNGLYQRIPPGFRFYLVGDIEAFEMRYGSDSMHLVDGVFSGKLNDSGEEICIRNDATLIREVFYDDSPPWPEEADGPGHSLILLNLDASRTRDSRPEYWRISSDPEQSPFVSDVYTYEMWKADVFLPAVLDDESIVGPDADPDCDGSPNIAEYAFGSGPLDPEDGERTRVQAGLDRAADQNYYLRVFYFRKATADDAIITVEISSDPTAGWSDEPTRVRLISGPLLSTDLDDGSRMWLYQGVQQALPIPGRREFIRLSVRMRE